jgi:hypothetical protein
MKRIKKPVRNTTVSYMSDFRKLLNQPVQRDARFNTKGQFYQLVFCYGIMLPVFFNVGRTANGKERNVC